MPHQKYCRDGDSKNFDVAKYGQKVVARIVLTVHWQGLDILNLKEHQLGLEKN